MMWNYYGGVWIWMLPAMLLFTVGTIALLFWLIRASNPSRASVDPALDKLRVRLAAGEISQEEFEKIRRILQEPAG